MKKLGGHRNFWEKDDIVFEWEEPKTVRIIKAEASLKETLKKKFLGIIPLILIFSLIVLDNIFNLSSSIRPLLGILSLLLFLPLAVFIYQLLGSVFIRFWKTKIRFCLNGIGKWGADNNFSCEYKDIESIQIEKTPTCPDVILLNIRLKNGKGDSLGIKDGADYEETLQFITKKGVSILQLPEAQNC